MTYYQFVHAVEMKMREEVQGEISVDVYTARKNNGIIREGIVLRREGINVAPTIYLEEFYEKYCAGYALEYIVFEILRLYEKVCFQKSWDEVNISNYENVKDRIIYRLVNRKANEQMLKDCPFVPYLDLAIVFCVLLDVSGDGTATMMIQKEHLELWGVTEKEIYEQAKKQTVRLLPDDFMTMGCVICELTGKEIEDDEQMYVLSNQIRSYGAAAVLYEDRLEAIGMYLNSNYYVLPSSVHEVIIIPENKLPGEMCRLSAMVREINATQVQEEEVLANHAYYYDRAKKVLCM